MNTISRLAKAQEQAQKAQEQAEMKRLYAAYLEGGMYIDEACEMLRTGRSAGNGGAGKDDNQNMNQNKDQNQTMINVEINNNIENRQEKQSRIATRVWAPACVSCNVLVEHLRHPFDTILSCVVDCLC